MPTIRSSTALRNDYSKISKYCHETDEPVFITVNGEGDLAVMSIEAYEKRERALEVREKLLEAQVQNAEGTQKVTLDEAMEELREFMRETTSTR